MHSESGLSVFGLGKLGCTMLACFAHKGWKVIGVDINPNFIDSINSGHSPIYEPGVEELIHKNKELIKATQDVSWAIQNSDVSFIIVPTPSLPDGSFDTKVVNSVAKNIGNVLKDKNTYHLVVVTSTVLPGNTDSVVKILEENSGKKCNIDFGVCYNPDFIALGTVVRDFLNPDMILIGESDNKAGEFLSSIHERLADSNPSVHRMSFENAELSKISLNAFCTLKITFANVLAEICENLPNGNVDVVTSAIGADTRVGKKYLKGGLSYGGPCFPRDNKAFAFTATQLGVKNILAEKTDQINNYQRDERIPSRILDLLNKNGGNVVAVLGLTYKADTTLVEESAPMAVVKTLLKKNVKVKVFDPAGMTEAKSEFGSANSLLFTQSAKDCLLGADLCFIATPWKEFTSIKEDDFLEWMKSPWVIDGWNLYKWNNDSKVKYVKIGYSKV